MLGMLKRHEIEILLKAGHSKVEVARLSGASLRSVKRVAQEGPVMQIDDGLERPETGDADSGAGSGSFLC